MAEKTFWMEEEKPDWEMAFPEFLNDGYAPPDWEMLANLSGERNADELEVEPSPLDRRYGG